MRNLALILILLLAGIALAVGSGSGGGSPPTTTSTTVAATTTGPSTTLQQRAFLCSDLATTLDRVRCRLQLTPGERENELRVVYLPEECRPLQGERRSKCIALYDSLQKCWAFTDRDRINCVKNEIKLGDIKEEKESCTNDTACMVELKEKVYSLIKFRFYNLEERAEKMLENGVVDTDTVSKLVTDIEAKKREFNDAKTFQERREIILQVRELWKEFLAKVRQ